MTTRKELVAALQLRYRSATFGERIKILDEFVALTGYHRKHAIRLLREERRVSRYLSPQSCSQRLSKCSVRGHRDD
jgi:hypothetical protein